MPQGENESITYLEPAGLAAYKLREAFGLVPIDRSAGLQQLHSRIAEPLNLCTYSGKTI